jgi:uncharacterized protein (TIGR03084 family)
MGFAMMQTAVLEDLEAEQDELEALLAGLSAAQWRAPSAAEGWSVTDVVLHLAQTEEAVAVATAGRVETLDWRRFGTDVDSAMDAMVRAERAPSAAVFERWRAARRAALAGLRAADPARPLQWVTTRLKPATLATTRLAEHWAHGLDITGALALDRPDTDRLRHVAWLGHATLPYAFGVAGLEPAAVLCVLTAPGGATWRFGPPDADSTVTGPAGAFCRVGARRLPPERSGLATAGPHAAAALGLLRNWATV